MRILTIDEEPQYHQPTKKKRNRIEVPSDNVNLIQLKSICFLLNLAFYFVFNVVCTANQQQQQQQQQHGYSQ